MLLLHRSGSVYRTTRSPPLVFRILRGHFVSQCSQKPPSKEESSASLLLRCVETTDSDLGRAIHGGMIKGSAPFCTYLCNRLINIYVKHGDIKSGLKLFEEIPEKNVVSWSVAIAALAKHGRPEEALSLFCRMHCEGKIGPNEFTLVSALHACSLHECLACSYQIYALIVRLGFDSNTFLINAFLTALIRHCEITEALEAFNRFPCKDIVSWNALMAGYLQCSCVELPEFWRRMNAEGVKPDAFTLATVLSGVAALCDLKLGLQVHGQLVKSGHGADTAVGNSLMLMYIKNQNLVDVFEAFDDMHSTEVSSWTQLAAGCVECGEASKALDVVAKMRIWGFRPNKYTLATVLNACAQLTSLEEGKKLHGLRIKLGADIDICVDNSLLDMYVRCGCMASARDVFRSMDDRSVVSWTTMIMGCAKNGQAGEALQIFEKMKQEGAEPNHITFLCLLYACSLGGFVNEGWKYFSSMMSDHGISPSEDHYACMVNLLSRAGCIKEAEEFILGMPFRPGPLVWQTLLSACQDHGDTETGKRAAEQALDLDSRDPSTYVSSSNMFAALSNWNSVGTLRELMENRNVKKTPGSSWIGMNKNV